MTWPTGPRAVITHILISLTHKKIQLSQGDRFCYKNCNSLKVIKQMIPRVSLAAVLKKKKHTKSSVLQINEEEIKLQTCHRLCWLIRMTGIANDGSSLDAHTNIQSGEGGSAPVNRLISGLYLHTVPLLASRANQVRWSHCWFVCQNWDTDLTRFICTA